VEGEAIRVGLGAVKGVGEAASQAIVQARLEAGRFGSMSQFVRALPERTVNRKVLECLVRAGAFDGVHPNRTDLLAGLDRLIEQATRQRQALESGQGFLFALDPDQEVATPPSGGVAPENRDEMLRGERETLGFYLSGHPLDRWERVLRDLHAVKVADLKGHAGKGAESAVVAGLVSGLKTRPIKDGRNKGRRMTSFMLEDQTSSVRVVAFADAFERVEKLLVDGAALLVTAALRSPDPDHVELGLEEVVPLEGIEYRKASALRIELDVSRHGAQEQLDRLHELLLSHEGRTSLRLRLLGPGWLADVLPSRVLGVDPDGLIPEIDSLFGQGHVELLF